MVPFLLRFRKNNGPWLRSRSRIVFSRDSPNVIAVNYLLHKLNGTLYEWVILMVIMYKRPFNDDIRHKRYYLYYRALDQRENRLWSINYSRPKSRSFCIRDDLLPIRKRALRKRNFLLEMRSRLWSVSWDIMNNFGTNKYVTIQEIAIMFLRAKVSHKHSKGKCPSLGELCNIISHANLTTYKCKGTYFKTLYNVFGKILFHVMF